jgi:hypothetical protein
MHFERNLFEKIYKRGGLGLKSIRGFIKGHRDIAEKPHITLKKPLLH